MISQPIEQPIIVDFMEVKLGVFQLMEDIIQVILPKYLKNLLVLNGYDSPASFLDYSDAEISELENFARQDLFDRADEKKIAEIYSEAYLGNYIKKIKERSFTIPTWHKKLLRHFSIKCKEKSDTITLRIKEFYRAREKIQEKISDKKLKRKTGEKSTSQESTSQEPPTKRL